MGSSGSVLFNFEKKGRLTLSTDISEDRLIELAIEAGVDDVVLEVYIYIAYDPMQARTPLSAPDYLLSPCMNFRVS